MDSTNPFLKNKIASLGAVIKAIEDTLAKYELGVVSFPVGDGDKIGLTTRVIHSSGQWIEETIFLPVGEEKGKSTAQMAGSMFSYLRRYTLAAIFRLYTDEDDDANTQKAERAKKDTATESVEGTVSFTPKQTEALITERLAKNLFEAEGMLRKSSVLNATTPVPNVIFWARKYREQRPDADSETSSEEAAKYADEEYRAELERRKQDKAGPA
jgi:hypothetical protein